MGVPPGYQPTKNLTTTSAILPTPAQTPQTHARSLLSTPIADSCGDLFDLDKGQTKHTAPSYTNTELHLALDNPPVQCSIRYDTHLLPGSLYYMPDLFGQLYERFLDISPSDYPQLSDEYRKPWVLFSQSQGLSWIDENVLRSRGTNTIQCDNAEPAFVGVTDSLQLLLRIQSGAPSIGHIDLWGTFHSDLTLGTPNDIIVALPCGRPLRGSRQADLSVLETLTHRPTRPPDAGKHTVQLKDFTPAPTSAAVLDTVRKIIESPGKQDTTACRAPKKAWMNKHLTEHLTEIPTTSTSAASQKHTSPGESGSLSPAAPQQPSRRSCGVLSQTSPLWAHRGNEALFKRQIWQQLCYASEVNESNVDEKGGTRIPAGHFQVLFEDKQARMRVPGTHNLAAVDGKWYERSDAGADDGAVGTEQVMKTEGN